MGHLMPINEAEEFLEQIIKILEIKGINHYTAIKEQRGNQQYFEFKISIKVQK